MSWMHFAAWISTSMTPCRGVAWDSFCLPLLRIWVVLELVCGLLINLLLNCINFCRKTIKWVYSNYFKLRFLSSQCTKTQLQWWASCFRKCILKLNYTDFKYNKTQLEASMKKTFISKCLKNTKMKDGLTGNLKWTNLSWKNI